MRFTKKFLSIILSIIMVVTTVPMTVLTAFADTAVGADWDFTSSFSEFCETTQGKYEVPVSDSIGSKKMTFQNYDTTTKFFEGGMYNVDGFPYSNDLNTVFDDNEGLVINFSIKINQVKDHDFGLFSLGTDHDGSGFYNIINVHKDGAVYYNGATSPACNIGALQAQKYYVSIRLKSGVLTMVVNDTTYTISNNCTRPATDFKFLALGVNSDGNYPNMTTYKVNAYQTSYDALLTLVSKYESMMDGNTVYTNMEEAYNAYVEANKIIDARNYGKISPDQTDAVIALSSAMVKMTPYLPIANNYDPVNSSVDTSYSFSNLIHTFSTNGVDDNISGVLYSEGTNGSSTPYTSKACEVTAAKSLGTNFNVKVGMQYGSMAFLYNGVTPCENVIMSFYNSAASEGGMRSLLPSTSGFTVTTNWHATDSNAKVYTGVNHIYGAATDHSSVMQIVKNNQRYFYNTLRYTGTPATTLTTVQNITWNVVIYSTKSGYDSKTGSFDFGNTNVTDGPTNIYILDIAQLITKAKSKLDVIATSSSNSITNYRQGGLATRLHDIDVVTAYDPNSDFSGNAELATKVTNCETNINNKMTSLDSVATATQDTGYNALRNAIDYEGTLANLDDGVTYSVRSLGEGENTIGFDSTKWTTFKNTYTNAVGFFDDTADLYNYSTDAATTATALIAAFNALELSAVTVQPPSFDKEDGSYIGPNDTVVLTNNDSTATVTVTGTSASVGTIPASGTATFAPFNGATNLDSVTLVAEANNAGNTISTTVTYNLFKAPLFSAIANQKIEQGASVTLTSSQPEENATMQYSFDGTEWVNGSFAVPFSNESTESVVTLYAREVKGTSISAVSSVTLVKDNVFDIISKTGDEISTKSYTADSTFYLYDTTSSYTSTVYYTVTVDGNAPSAFTAYNHLTGISASGYSSNSVVTITVYSVNNNDSRVVSRAFVNGSYDSFVYQESFDGAKINGATFTTGNVRGKNGTVTTNSARNNVKLVSLYTPDNDRGPNSSDGRKNVLYIPSDSGTNFASKNFVEFINPINTTVPSAVAKAQGVTISFWRAYDVSDVENGGFNGDFWNGSQWNEAIGFVKTTSDDQGSDNYYYLSFNSTGTLGLNMGNGGGSTGNYLDYFPNMQDPTQHAAGNTTKYWAHIALTIDPEKGIMIYVNGEPHPVDCENNNLNKGGGAYSDVANANSPELAQEILDYITSGSTKFLLGAGGGVYNRQYTSTYYDDIRVYTEVKTQVDINNMYTDEFADVKSNYSTAHDPTNVTVYTLNGCTLADSTVVPDGKQVGEEYLLYHDISLNDTTIVKDVDYYSFGTGMTVYHSKDNVRWEVIGDSEGRCGYQNEELFGAEYHTALAVPLAYAGLDSANEGAGHLQWAPHVMYNLSLDRWVYYGSTSSWGSQKSAIFYCIGKENEAPLRFDYAGEIYHSTTWPNAIDSCVYYEYDSNNKPVLNSLHLIFGSYQYNNTDAISYIRLNADGSANADPTVSGICKDLNGDAEGGYVVYRNGYYYLYVAFGSNGGSYQERVFRSTRPDGGFVSYESAQGTSGDALNKVSGVNHGRTFISSHQLAAKNYINWSTGHNSVYNAINNNGEIVAISAMHSRILAAGKKKALPDGNMATRQSTFTGNVAVHNLVGYTKNDWAVAFPLEYNGTDTTNGKFSAEDIEGIYAFNDLMTSVDNGYSTQQKLTILAIDDTHAKVYTENLSQDLTLEYGTDFYGNDVTYISMVGVGDTGSDTKYEGLIAKQVVDEKDVYMFSWFQTENESGTQFAGSHFATWGYRSSALPTADLESAGDIVSNTGVIYSHKRNDTYDLYGNEISNDYEYRINSSHQGERSTTFTTTYPYQIEADDSSVIYCWTDRDLAAEGYTGGSYMLKYIDENGTVTTDPVWYDASGTAYTTDEAEALYASDNTVVLATTYGLYGYLSNFFSYGNGEDGGYPETGVKLAVEYSCVSPSAVDSNGDPLKGHKYGEYQFLYVMPNPAMAHTIIGIRNQNTKGGYSPVSLYSRFGLSEGNAVIKKCSKLETASQNTTTATAVMPENNNDTADMAGVGTFIYLDDFGDYESTGDGSTDYNGSEINSNTEGCSYNYTSPKLIDEKFKLRDTGEGVNAGSYSVREFEDEKDSTFMRYAYPVDVNYYIDYSDEELYDNDGNGDNLIRMENGKPAGYYFEFNTSNLYWNKKVEPQYIKNATSYYRNDTDLSVNFTQSCTHGLNPDTTYCCDTYTVGSSNYTKYLNSSQGADTLDENPINILKSKSDSALKQGFTSITRNTTGTNTWTGKVRFSGKDTVKKNENTAGDNADEYANFVLEQGLSREYTFLWNIWYPTNTTYQFYNIGVNTCDKGAIRDFLNKYANKVLLQAKDSSGNLYLIPDGGIESGKYTVSSYNEYLDALEEAYFFLENTHNTTYNGTGDNAVAANDVNGENEYKTAYRTSGVSIPVTYEIKDEEGNVTEHSATIERPAGSAIYDSTDLGTGADVFGDGTTTATDPVQTRLIDNIITAYNNLFTITDYEVAASNYEEANERLDQLITNADGNYTTTSVQVWQNFMDDVSDCYNYVTDKNDVDEDNEYWRYTDVTGSEYKKLQEAADRIEESLMPVIDTTTLSDNITYKTNDEDEGLMALFDSSGNQKVSYNSWVALKSEIATAQGYVTDATTANAETGFIPGMYSVTGTKTYTFNSTEYTYQTFDPVTDGEGSVITDIDTIESMGTSATDKLSAEQNNVRNEDGDDGILMNTDLIAVDAQEAYDSFDGIYAVMDSLDFNKYIPSKVDDIRAEIASKYNSVYEAIDSDTVTEINTFFGRDVVNDSSVLCKTGTEQTDPITAELLSYNSTINVTDKADYVKQFNAKLTVQNDGVENRTVALDPQYYGDPFDFNLTDTVNDNQYVVWSASVFDYDSNYENPFGSFKIVTNDKSFSRIADADIAVSANIVTGQTGNTYLVKICNAYGKVVNIKYVNDENYQISEDAELADSYDVIPFYTFVKWMNVKEYDEDDNLVSITVYPAYEPAETTYAFTANAGTLSAGTAKFNQKITLTYTGAEEFVAWASKSAYDDNKYSIASYNSTYSFYAAGDMQYTPIVLDNGEYKVYTSNTDKANLNADGYVASNFSINTNLDYSKYVVDVDNSAHTTTAMTPYDFLVTKLENKAPFISVIAMSTDSDGYRHVYAQITDGANAGYACTVLLGGVKVGNITNILSNGQFNVKTATYTSFKFNVTYDLELQFNGSNTAQNTVSSVSITDSTETVSF